jgi:subtilisin family serine protease
MRIVETASTSLLVRSARGMPTSARGLRLAGGPRFAFAPLFPSDAAPRPRGRRGLHANTAPRWQIATPLDGSAWRSAWDEAHALAAAVAAYVEPDLLTELDLPNPPPMRARREPPRSRRSLAATPAIELGEPSDDYWPAGDRLTWHLDASGLRAARDEVGVPEQPSHVLHLDTGFSPTHLARPAHLVLDHQRNFVAGESPHDASDPRESGPLRNPGHGTATLTLLAGREVSYSEHGRSLREALGGDPNARVIPCRVGSSVIHLRTSAMAQGIEYAAMLAAGEPGCDVVSISLGGLPSEAWAEAVNRAYESGVVVVAAAGNRIGRTPPASLVWPARFARVIAACGIDESRQPYFRPFNFTHMQGCFGPRSAMRNALGAFTPNVPWADIRDDRVVHRDGAGTSSATPQVAAAASLWIAKWRRELAKYPQPWMRAEATRRALYRGADRPIGGGLDSKDYGRGLLRADEALAVRPPSRLTKTPADELSFPLVRSLLPAGVPEPRRRMFEVEAMQIVESLPGFADALGDTLRTSGGARSRKLLAAELSRAEMASLPLRAVMDRAARS